MLQWTSEGTPVESQPCSLCGHPVRVAGLGTGARIPCPACSCVIEVVGGGSGRVFGNFAEGHTLAAPSDTPGSGPGSPTRPHPAAAKPPGSERGESPIPGYVVIEELGRGGMAVVFKAQQTSLDRIVALKIMAPRLAKDPGFVQRFEREAKALAALNHPNITSIYDRGQAGDKIFFVMEFVEGPSLRDIMKNAGGRLPQERVLSLMIQVAEALGYVHDRGTIHRDVKPENVLVAAGDKVKVTDFGLAAMTQANLNVNLTGDGMMMGTLNYMPPEQRSDAKSVDHRADIYSFGVMLYELLTGSVPLGKWDAATALVPELDARFDEVISMCLKANRVERYQRIDQAVAALREIQTGPGATAELNIPLLGASESRSAPPPRPRADRSAPSRSAPTQPSPQGATNNRDLEALVEAARKDMLAQRTRGLPTRIHDLPGIDPPKRRLRTFLGGLLLLLAALAGGYAWFEPTVLVGFLMHFPQDRIKTVENTSLQKGLEHAYAFALARVRTLATTQPRVFLQTLSWDDPVLIRGGLKALRHSDSEDAAELAAVRLGDVRDEVFKEAAQTLGRMKVPGARARLEKAWTELERRRHEPGAADRARFLETLIRAPGEERAPEAPAGGG